MLCRFYLFLDKSSRFFNQFIYLDEKKDEKSQLD